MRTAHDATETCHHRLAGPGLHWCSLPGAFVLLSLLLACAKADGAEEGNGELWLGVSRVRGRVTIEYHSGRNDHDEISHFTVDNSEQVQVDFIMERQRPPEKPLPAGLPPQLVEMMRSQMASTLKNERSPRNYISWQAVSAKITGVTCGTTDKAWPWFQMRLTTNANFSGPPLDLHEFFLGLHTDTGVWQLVSPDRLREKYREVTSGTELNTSWNETRVIHEVSEVDGLHGTVFDGKLAGKPGLVNGTSKVEQGGTADNPTGWSTKIGRLEFWPEFDDVEVEVTIDGHDKWRPEGSITNPTEPGNHLVARATLVPKGEGRVQDLPKVKNFRFELLDTSREPGVCLNWPLEAKDTDYDLRLAVVAGGTLSKSDQQLEVTDPRQDDKGQACAEVKINSYDFGGRASLRAICLLADGREIVGVMKGEGEMPRLPKMKGPDWIAESWRKEKNVEKLAARDDDEKVEGQKDNGDGYTLYEEYRGWVVNEKRLEGDPEKKDFFVLNLIGGEAEPGLDLFAQLSELKVHSKLLPSEMSEETRLMNGNRRDGPHNKDQHGVWVKTFASKSELGDDGAMTVMNEKGVAGRPGNTKGVGLLARSNAESVFNKPFNLPAEEANSTFDRAIAHELLHAVGVEHHGAKGDYKIDLLFIALNHPDNRLGEAYYTESLQTYNPIRVLDEAGQDLAAKKSAEINWVIQQARIDLLPKYLPKTRHDFEVAKGYKVKTKYATPEVQAEAEFYNDFAATYAIKQRLVGVELGAHSGEQDCVMRYYFAEYYEAKGLSGKTLYKVTPGTERIGRQICRSGKGTGINAADHKPQSRYGDSAPGAGNCFEQICPNDAIPPRKAKE